MKLLTLAACFLFLEGCASMFTAKTRATWTEPGGKSITYESDKEQIGLDATFDPRTGLFHIRVDKAGTQEAVIRAALEQQQSMSKLMEMLMPIIQKSAAMGAGS